MTRAASMLLLAPFVLHAQLQLSILNGSQSTPVSNGSTVSLGQFAQGVTGTATIVAANTGNAGVTVTAVATSGSGFEIANTPPLPYSFGPGGSMSIEVEFSADPGPGNYSAPLEITTQGGASVEVLLTATFVATATLTSASPCSGPDSSLTIQFGSLAPSQTAVCSFQLTNNTSQALTVAGVKVNGTGFLLSAVSTPLNLPRGVSSTFTITFEPTAAAVYSGTLTIDSQSFPLTGTAFNLPLPTPMLQFDTQTPQSGQQITLTMTLPSPAPSAVSGSINLAFQPDPSVAGVAVAAGDPAVNFVLTNAKSMPFAIQPGSTQATLGGEPNAIFATGTTAGKITFTVSTSAQISGDPTTSIALAPIPISVDDVAATAIAGALNVQIWGFDNTYSAGPMSFTFLDNQGNPIGAGPVTANFTSNFASYFNTAADGSAFQMLVTFPIAGNSAEVGSVNVTMTNAAGAATITNLVFLNDTGTCVLIGTALSCPGEPTQ